MKCLVCKATNLERAKTCVNCGVQLAGARVALNLERAEAALRANRDAETRKYLNDADIAMVGASSEERKQWLLSARAFYLQGRLYFREEQLEAAIQELLGVIQEVEQHEQERGWLSEILFYIGFCHLKLKQMDSAHDFFIRSYELATSVNRPDIVHTVVTNLGNMYYELGNLERAAHYYQLALDSAIATADPSRQALAYRRLARLYGDQGPFNQALECATSALGLAHHIGSSEQKILLICECANVFTRAGHFDEAEYHLNQAMEMVVRASGRVAKEAVLVYQLELAQRQGNPDGWLMAVGRVEEGVAAGSEFRSQSTVQLARYYAQTGDKHMIRRLLNSATTVLEQGRSNSGDAAAMQRVAGLLHGASGHLEPATRYLKLALAAPKQPRYEQAEMWLELGDVLQRLGTTPKDTAEAQDALARAAAIYREMGLPLATSDEPAD